MKAVILPEVEDYCGDLIEILYQKEYFGFRASARGYVAELVDAIRDTLPKPGTPTLRLRRTGRVVRRIPPQPRRDMVRIFHQV